METVANETQGHECECIFGSEEFGREFIQCLPCGKREDERMWKVIDEWIDPKRILDDEIVLDVLEQTIAARRKKLEAA
jgi:hypothetical protein